MLFVKKHLKYIYIVKVSTLVCCVLSTYIRLLREQAETLGNEKYAIAFTDVQQCYNSRYGQLSLALTQIPYMALYLVVSA